MSYIADIIDYKNRIKNGEITILDVPNEMRDAVSALDESDYKVHESIRQIE